jgi:hypothetical protein
VERECRKPHPLVDVVAVAHPALLNRAVVVVVGAAAARPAAMRRKTLRHA